MSYSSGETLILARLQAISGSVWTSGNTAQGKWNLLDSGNYDHYAVLKMGEGSNDSLALSANMRRFTTIISIYVSYTLDGTSYTNLLGYHEAILDKFDSSRQLGDTGGTVSDARVVRWDAIEELWNAGGNGPRWLKQNFYIEWREESGAITYA